jgi:hypothetical protein
MANWDFITEFNSEASDWLEQQNLPHPSVSNSKMPTTQQILSAWKLYDERDSVLIDGFRWDAPDYVPADGFKMRGDRRIELQILRTICEHCGRLWLYPDTGEPAIIVDEATDPEQVSRFHAECGRLEDSWERFYRGQYAT